QRRREAFEALVEEPAEAYVLGRLGGDHEEQVHRCQRVRVVAAIEVDVGQVPQHAGEDGGCRRRGQRGGRPGRGLRAPPAGKGAGAGEELRRLWHTAAGGGG